ncbi:MAG TPA: cyclic nucleotide-binding domain-containing protein [Rhodospirillales bacterium]|nr:cyclic nucleotide-binding domain-containing protein [Rhodospirillales bacterium]
MVEIMKSADRGGDIVLGTVSKGAIFGKMALIDDNPRMATARAAKVCTLIVVTRPAFEAKASKSDPFIRDLLKIPGRERAHD